MNSLNQQSAALSANSSPAEASGPANILTASGALDGTRAFTEIHLADGRVLRLDTRSLMPDSTAPSGIPFVPDTRSADDVAVGDGVTIPLIEEHLILEKRIVETGKVRLRKSVEAFDQQLDEPLAVRTYDIERVILNQVVNAAPGVREEGETTVYPLVEEHLVLTRQLVLKEEVRVTRRTTERRDTQVVTLHRDHLTVEREPSGPAANGEDLQTHEVDYESSAARTR